METQNSFEELDVFTHLGYRQRMPDAEYSLERPLRSFKSEHREYISALSKRFQRARKENHPMIILKEKPPDYDRKHLYFCRMD